MSTITLSKIIQILERCKDALNECKGLPVSNQWLCVYTIQQVFFKLLWERTSLDMFNFQKIITVYDVANIPAQEWVSFTDGYLTLFIDICNKELVILGGVDYE